MTYDYRLYARVVLPRERVDGSILIGYPLVEILDADGKVLGELDGVHSDIALRFDSMTGNITADARFTADIRTEDDNE